MNDLMTDEFKSKNSPKKILLILLILITIIIVMLITLKVISGIKKDKEEKSKQKDQATENILNAELNNTYSFAIDDNNYIVAIKKDKTVKKIYNILQGTAPLGDFKGYTYFDKKLYLMFSNNKIYQISLTEGNKSYQLEKVFEYENIDCTNKETTNDIAIHKDLIYFNNSNCGVSFYYTGKKQISKRLNDLYKFSSPSVNIAYNKETSSLYTYQTTSKKIYRFSEGTKETTTLLDNITTDKDIKIIDNILIYSNKNEQNTYDYYGYNLKTNKNALIVKDALDLIKYKEGFIYYKNDKIVYKTSKKETIIYNKHYDTLTDFAQINENIIQIVDSKENSTKKRIINIDLKNKNNKEIVKEKYKDVKIFEEIENGKVSN